MRLLLRCLILTLVAITLLSVNVNAQTETIVQTATVTSDKPDYAPLSNAVFTGSGFAPNEDVVLKVKNMTQPCNTTFADSSYMPWTVQADADGNFVTNWTVCNCAGDSLKLRATGQSSGLIAVVKFSDDKNITIAFSGSGKATVTSDPGDINATYDNGTITGTITDGVGNTASVTVNNINIDKTNPTITPVIAGTLGSIDTEQ